MAEKFEITKKLVNTGGNLALIVPKQSREAYDLESGEFVRATFELIDESRGEESR